MNYVTALLSMDRRKKDSKRRYCDHCDEYVSTRSYFRHRELMTRSKLNKSCAIDDNEPDFGKYACFVLE